MTKRLLSICILIAYSVILIKVMVFKDLPVISIGPLMFNFGGTHEGPANLVPFKTILPYLLGEKGFVIAFINLAGNIVLLVPIGFIIPFVRRNITWKKSLMLAMAAGLTIEGMQAMLHVGIFDIDDVILNGLGFMVGHWAFTIFAKMKRSAKLKTIIIISVMVVAAASALCSFIMSHKRQEPVSFRSDAGNIQADSVDKKKSDIVPGKDPCRGTGGTGQVVSFGNSSITIKLNNGSSQIIYLTDKTMIKNSAGSLSQSDLKAGDRVTVVVLSNDIASVVLVCNAQSQ